MSDDALPILGSSSPSRRLTGIGAMIAAFLLLLTHAGWLAGADLTLWHLALLPLAWVAADLVSGIVHWTADTWGTEETALIGRRFIRPFRVHHHNANDIVSRPFLDLNGDVALGVIPILAGAFMVPAPLRCFLVALAVCLLPTNQIHQWAHRAEPPRGVRALQRAGLILGPAEHRLHHTAPFRTHFCITSGWCNGFLALFPQGQGGRVALDDPINRT